MPRWVFFMPLTALVAASLVIGLSLGRKAARDTETEVIRQIAARYVAEQGGRARMTDCAARPAVSGGLWLVITCKGSAGKGREYFIDRFGAIRHAGTLPRRE